MDRKETKFKSEIPSDLLFEKILEVVASSNFKLAEKNFDEKQILVITSPNFWTWGENIYIEIIPVDSGSEISIHSTTLFGSFSWKRNEKNFQEFYASFEQSLTI